MRTAVLKRCEGEAHSNAFIDNCSICMPSWGSYWTCPDCEGKLAYTKRSNVKACQNETCSSVGQRFSTNIPEGT